MATLQESRAKNLVADYLNYIRDQNLNDAYGLLTREDRATRPLAEWQNNFKDELAVLGKLKEYRVDQVKIYSASDPKAEVAVELSYEKTRKPLQITYRLIQEDNEWRITWRYASERKGRLAGSERHLR